MSNTPKSLDELAREAGAEATRAGRHMPIVPIEQLRRRRLMLTAGPIVATGLAAWVAILLFVTPPGQSAPVATSVTTTTLQEATTSSTTTPTTTSTSTVAAAGPETVQPFDVGWTRASLTAITDDQGAELYEVTPSPSVGRPVVWDGGDGFVVATDTDLVWYRPGGTQVISGLTGNLIEAAITEETWVVGVDRWEDDEGVLWFDLVTGDEVAAPANARTFDGETFAAGDRTAMIVDPDWSDVDRAEDGAPIPPFDLPELVVTENGEEVLRMAVGSERRPYVELWDFDGRRLVLAALPQEPALPPTTAWMIDLECSECTERIETDGMEWFDLIGTVPTEGPVEEPLLP